MASDKINAMMILEILGKPKEYVLESLTAVVEKLSTEKGVKIIGKTIHEPLNVKNSKELFTTFAEIDIEFESLEHYIYIMFGYMPSNIQIISPENLSLSNSFLNELGNKIIQKLHNYDAITKKVLYEHQQIMEKIKSVSPDLYKRLTSQKSKPQVNQNKKSEEVQPDKAKEDPSPKKDKKKK